MQMLRNHFIIGELNNSPMLELPRVLCVCPVWGVREGVMGTGFRKAESKGQKRHGHRGLQEGSGIISGSRRLGHEGR